MLSQMAARTLASSSISSAAISVDRSEAGVSGPEIVFAVFQPCAACARALAASALFSGKAWSSAGTMAGNDRRTLQPPEGAKRELRGLPVEAAGAGLEDRQIARCRRAEIFSEENVDASRRNGLRLGHGGQQQDTAGEATAPNCAGGSTSMLRCMPASLAFLFTAAGRAWPRSIRASGRSDPADTKSPRR